MQGQAVLHDPVHSEEKMDIVVPDRPFTPGVKRFYAAEVEWTAVDAQDVRAGFLISELRKRGIRMKRGEITAA